MYHPSIIDVLLDWLIDIVKKNFLNQGKSSSPTLNDSANSSSEKNFAILNQTKPVDTLDSFMKMRSRATKVGAWAGLGWAIVGLLIIGFSLEYIIDSRSNATDASGIAFISIFLACSGYPLIGSAAGALIGRLSIKRDVGLEDDSLVFPHGMIGGSIAGLVVGILPYLLLWIYLLWSGESLF